MTIFNDTFDKATPAGSDDPAEADNRIRETKAAVQERENVDHYWPLTGTEVSDAAAGEHRKVTLRTGSAPSAVADKGFVYAKDVSGKAELFYRDEDGNEVQITTAGILNSLNLTGVQTVAGVKTFSSSPIVPAPTTDLQAATKKHVDDSVPTSGFWTHSGATVFASAAAPTTWTDLDLSSVVGSNYALVLLKIQDNSAGNWYKVRTNGETSDLSGDIAKDMGCSAVNIFTAGRIGYVMIETDSAGIVEWICGAAETTIVTLAGYIK